MGAIENIIDKINKDLGATLVVKASQALGIGYRRLSTGCLSLDIICGGNSEYEWGVPTGRITEFWGIEGSAKTTVALNIIKSAQEKGNCGAFVNVEGAWDNAWAEKIGVDLGKLIFARVPSAETAESVLYELIATPGVGVVVLDSIAMMTSQSELETDTKKKNVQPGTQPRAVNRVVRHIASAFNRWPIDSVDSIDGQPAVIFLNQLREKIGAYGNPEYSPGGKGKDHQASIRVQMAKGELHRAGAKDDKKSPAVAITIKARCNKNKVWAPFQNTEFLLYIRDVKKKGVPHNTGEIDQIDQLAMLGLHYGLVERRGAVYEYDQISVSGFDAFKAELHGFDAASGQLKDEILEAAWERKGL